MKKLREFICYNQKQIVRFEYEISQLHKIFRKSVDKKNTIATNEKYYRELLLKSFDMLNNIYQENSKLISDIYMQDIDITIKMVNDKSVINIYSDIKSQLFEEEQISKNSCLSAIMEDKQEYCIDDIGLIIPMSISNTDLDKNSLFYKHFFEKQSGAIARTKYLDKDIEKIKTIFGFCVIKFENKDLSNIKSLEDIGFIVTDILSLYLVFFYNYTSGSETVREFIKNKIKE